MTELILLTVASIVLLLVFFGLASYLIYSVLIYFRGAPFVPASRQRVARMVQIANLAPGSTMADLGSGDGRIVLAFAQNDVEAHGYELHPHLVWYSRFLARLKGLSDRSKFFKKDIFEINYQTYDCVTLYVFPEMVARMESKLQRELKPGARVVSLGFPFPHWSPTQKQGSIYLYVKE